MYTFRKGVIYLLIYIFYIATVTGVKYSIFVILTLYIAVITYVII